MARIDCRTVSVMAAGLLLISVAANAAKPGTGSQRIIDAAKQQKYTFVLFYRQEDSATKTMEQALRSGLQLLADRTAIVKVRINDPAERQVVSRFDATRSPMPTAMAIAPNGAVTGVFPLKINVTQIHQAILTPKYADMVKALQSQKIVLLCLQPGAGGPIPKGVADFEADPIFKGRSHRIVVNANDTRERQLFERMNVKPDIASPVVVVFAPPGTFLGRFDATVTRQILATTIHKSGKCSCSKCRQQKR